MKIRLFDASQSVYYEIDGKDMLIPAKDLGDRTSNNCYVGVFRSMNADQQTWYLGNLFMNKYYVVYDMTPYDEHGKDYIQVGIALQNTQQIIGEEHYDPDSDNYKPENEDIDQSTDIDGKEDSYDDKDYKEKVDDRKEEIENHNKEEAIDDSAGHHADTNSFVEWIKDNKIILIIVGSSLVGLIILGTIIYCCKKQRTKFRDFSFYTVRSESMNKSGASNLLIQ